VLTWAKKKRLTPRGWRNPCHDVPGQATVPGRVRYLTNDERTRLLAATKISAWPKLYLLALLAITTGARRDRFRKYSGHSSRQSSGNCRPGAAISAASPLQLKRSSGNGTMRATFTWRCQTSPNSQRKVSDELQFLLSEEGHLCSVGCVGDRCTW